MCGERRSRLSAGSGLTGPNGSRRTDGPCVCQASPDHFVRRRRSNLPGVAPFRCATSGRDVGPASGFLDGSFVTAVTFPESAPAESQGPLGNLRLGLPDPPVERISISERAANVYDGCPFEPIARASIACHL